MAKVTITIEDHPIMDKVSAKCEPSYETLMKMLQSGTELSPAHWYAILAINTIRNKSKKQNKLDKGILMPSRVGRA